jgi:hypothetical protein
MELQTYKSNNYFILLQHIKFLPFQKEIIFSCIHVENISVLSSAIFFFNFC